LEVSVPKSKVEKYETKQNETSSSSCFLDILHAQQFQITTITIIKIRWNISTLILDGEKPQGKKTIKEGKTSFQRKMPRKMGQPYRGCRKHNLLIFFHLFLVKVISSRTFIISTCTSIIFFIQYVKLYFKLCILKYKIYITFYCIIHNTIFIFWIIFIKMQFYISNYTF